MNGRMWGNRGRDAEWWGWPTSMWGLKAVGVNLGWPSVNVGGLLHLHQTHIDSPSQCVHLCSVVSNSATHGLQPTRRLCPGISRQESWSGLSFPTPGCLPDPGIKLTSSVSPALGGGFFTTATWEVEYSLQTQLVSVLKDTVRSRPLYWCLC